MKQHILIYFTCSLALLVSRNNYTQKSWSSPIDLSGIYNADSPVVAMDAASNIMAIWFTIGGKSQARYYTASTNTWSPIKYDLSTESTVWYPRVAMNPDGNAMAIWSIVATKVQVRYYTASTGIWSSIEDIATGFIDIDAHHWVAMDSAGNAMAVWSKIDPAFYTIQARYYNNSTGIWAPADNLSVNNDDSSYFPYVAMSSTGNAMAIWMYGANGMIQARYYNNSTSTWDPETALTTTDQHVDAPAVAMDPASNAMAVWQRKNDGVNYTIQARYYDGAWSPVDDLSEAGANALGPQVAMDTAGNAIAVWQKGTIQARYYNVSTGIWSPVEDLSETGASNPQVAMNPDGNAIAVWQKGTIQASYYDGSTGTWSTPTDLSEAGSSNPQVAMNSDGNAAAVWQKGTIIQGSMFRSPDNNVLLPLAYFNVMNCWFWPSLWPHPELKKRFYLH